MFVLADVKIPCSRIFFQFHLLLELYSPLLILLQHRNNSVWCNNVLLLFITTSNSVYDIKFKETVPIFIRTCFGQSYQSSGDRPKHVRTNVNTDISYFYCVLFCFILIHERLHGQNAGLLQNVLLSHPRVTEMSKLTCHVLTCDKTGT